MKKIAIFGGTFNPVHIGHKEMLIELSLRNDIEKIIVMPVNLPPHKSSEVALAEDRLNMCRLAFEDINNIEISDFEIKLTGKSYTVNTLERLKEIGIVSPYWIIGGDSLINFKKWVRYSDILKLAGLMVYRRKGTSSEEFDNAYKELVAEGASITLIDYSPTEISSTEIREALRSGKNAEKLLPKKVYGYIKEKNLYSEE